MSKKYNINTISISKNSFLIVTLFVISFLFLLYIRYLILTLILSFILASFTKYFAKLVQDKYQISYKYGIVLIFISLLIIVIASIGLLLPLLIKESYGLIELVNTLIKEIELRLIDTGFPTENLQLSQFTSFIPNLGQITLNILSALGGVITYTILIFVLAFYISINDNGLNILIKLFSPNNIKDNIPNIVAKAQYHIGKWAFVEASIALIMGVFIYTVLSILEFQYAAILGIIAGIFQLIPILGPALIYFIIILIAFTQSPILGVITILLIVVIHITKQFLLLPIIFKSLKSINGLLVVFALMIGGVLAGTLGVII
ncbi:MAG: AI-2E family transporter, partial [Candidatus Paceibacterota bacterium]